MKTDPLSIRCDYCRALPGAKCRRYGDPDNTTHFAKTPHLARRVDAEVATAVEAAKSAPEGSLLNDAYWAARTRVGSNDWPVYAFLNAIEWMQEREAS